MPKNKKENKEEKVEYNKSNKVISFSKIKNKKELEKDNLKLASDLINKAWEEKNYEKRMQLAENALTVSKDCVDAYILLGREKHLSDEERKELFYKALIAGEHLIGKRNFKEYKGNFWIIPETRPYMMAKVELAYLLWNIGDKKEAIEHLKEMLDLNPNDNQGVRGVLVNWLLLEDEDDYAEKILERYKEDFFANIIYNRALVAFKKGKINKANILLKEAIETNPYVPVYLKGYKNIPKDLPTYMGIGDEKEAVVYAHQFLTIWKRTDGAIDWLMENNIRNM